MRLLEPLQERDFALLTAGSLVSLLGDGFFSVALAWQVYEISNLPTALSIVGVAWTLPVVLFVLLG
ncbi:MAG TPA: MFS transporter, partial [Candidatus Limnocylindria bacterium]